MIDPGHRSEQTGSPGLDRIQANVRDLIALLRLVPFLFGGRHVKGVVFAAGVARIVRHGLGHRANGYIVTRNYGAVNISNVFGESAVLSAGDPMNEIALATAVDSTYDIWFF